MIRSDVVDLIVARYARQVVEMELEMPVAGPASEADLRRVQSDAWEKLGAVLDPAYLYLAGRADGIGAEGVSIYATKPRGAEDAGTAAAASDDEWIIQENLDYRAYGVGSAEAESNPADWLIYGAGGGEFVIQHLPTRRFQLRRRDNTSHATYDFATFEELLWEVFRYSLDLGDFPAS